MQTSVVKKKAVLGEELYCPACYYTGHKFVAKINEPLNISRVQCKQCGCIYFDSQNYDKPFYDVEYNKEFFRDTDIKKAGLKAHEISQILDNNRKDHNILEIGPGNGLVLYLLQIMGYKVQGLEIDESNADFIETEFLVDMDAGDFENFETDERFSFIYASHVIEHCESPNEFVANAYTLLKPGGCIYIETPDVKAQEKHGKEWKHFKTRNPYEHCCLLTYNSFKIMAVFNKLMIIICRENEQYDNLEIILRKAK